MDPLASETLSERIEALGRLPAADACIVALGVLKALVETHQAGRLHAQLTASQVQLSRHALTPERVALAEFQGIAAGSASGANRTLAGAYYLAPEQAKNTRDLDQRSDLYAVGVILYEAVTGRVPFAASTLDELLYKIVLEQPPPVRNWAPAIDAELAVIIDKARAKDPAQRFQTADEFEQALRTWAKHTQLDLDARALPATVPESVTIVEKANRPGNTKLWLVIAVVVVVVIALFFSR